MRLKKQITIQEAKLTEFDYESLNGKYEAVAYAYDLDVDVVKGWSNKKFTRHLNNLLTLLGQETEFAPLLEVDGVIYGFQAPYKMSAGEWADLEILAEKGNMDEIFALLYRPVTKRKWENGVFKKFIGFAKWMGVWSGSEFDFYDVEKYDYTTLGERAKVLKTLPLRIGAGALSFFLLRELGYKNHILASLEKENNKKLPQKLTT